MKALTDRLESYLAVLTAGRRWSRSTASSLAELLRPELAAGEELPDLVLLQELFARALARRWRRVTAADEARIAAESQHRDRLAELGREVRGLYRRVADLRADLRTALGPPAAGKLISFSGKTSRDPLMLLRQADRIVDRLRDRSRPLPDTSGEKHRDRAAAIEAAAETLRAAFDRSSLAGRKLEGAKADLRRTLDGYNRFFGRVAGWFEGTYRAAGSEERAAAVRPSGWRRGLRLEEAGRKTKAGGERKAAARGEAATAGGGDRRSRRLAPLGQVLRFFSRRATGEEERLRRGATVG